MDECNPHALRIFRSDGELHDGVGTVLGILPGELDAVGRLEREELAGVAVGVPVAAGCRPR